MDNRDYALMCKALGDSTRIQIFDMLKNGQMCACTILEEFHITQPTLSYHMKSLVDCGLVICDKVGKWCNYSLNCNNVRELTNFLAKKCLENLSCTCNQDQKCNCVDNHAHPCCEEKKDQLCECNDKEIGCECK